MEPEGHAIISEVEDEFEIEVSDHDAARFCTVGQLADAVHAGLRQSPEDPCPSQHGFYVIRKQLMGRLGLPRSAVRPDTPLEELLPRSTRPAAWRDLIRSLSGQSSDRVDLVRSRGLNLTVFLLIPALAILTTLSLVPLHLAGLGILLGLGMSRLADRLTASFKTEFTPGVHRVGDLIRFVATHDSKVWSREEVLERIRYLTVEELGLHPEKAATGARWWTPAPI